MSRRSAPTLLATLAAALLANASLAHADRSVLMVLDASGSMTQKLGDGQSRLEAAKVAVGSALGKVADAQRVGLRVYGHQSPTSARNCEDTSLVAPMGTAGATRVSIVNAMQPLSAKGYTPITLSLEMAASDLKAETAKEKVIVLVSDGRETCKGDPCATAKAMAAADASLIIHTIGFGVDAAARMQLQCIASVARGTYFDADNGKALGDKIGQAAGQVAAPPPPPPAKNIEGKPAMGRIQVPKLDGTGAELSIVDPVTGESVPSTGWMSGAGSEVAPGLYNLKLLNGLWRGIEVKSGAVTVVQPGFLAFKGGNTAHNDLFQMLDAETGEKYGDMAIHAFQRHAMIPGRYHVEVDGLLFKDVEFKPGEITVVDAAAVKLVDATYGGKYHMYRITTDDGLYSRTFIEGDPATLPPGRYTIEDTNVTDRPPFTITVKGGPSTVTYP